MQTNELLSEVRVDYSGESGVDRFVARLRKALAAMPEHEVKVFKMHMCMSSMPYLP